MAQVTLDWRELREDLFPQLCICCGAPASERIHRTFRWLPWWKPVVAVPLGVLLVPLGLIPLFGRAIYRDLLTRLAKPQEMNMRVPVCEEHRNHWLRRAILNWAGLGVLLLALVAGLVWLRSLPAWYWMGLEAGLVGWVTACLLAHRTMTRVVKITGTSLVLTNVSPEFVDRLEEARKSALPTDTKKGPPRLPGLPKYRVIGILYDGQKQVAATFDKREEADACARFLREGGKFDRVEIEDSEGGRLA
jgi:hypothetical protein